jgi:GNAT superfamily N-acetyltransferase
VADAAPSGVRLSRFSGSAADYRSLFRRVGENWLWFSRLVMPDAELEAILANPSIEVFELSRGDEEIGLLELDFSREGECELSFFGLVESEIGRGLGRYLMSEAIARAWAKPIRRFWVHTCSLDHATALDFYIRSGFRVYARSIEVAPDPRVLGHLPRSAAPHVPIVE